MLGSATCEHAITKLKAKADEKAVATTAAAAKKEHASSKKARDISLQVATGSNLLIKIERLHPFVLGSLLEG